MAVVEEGVHEVLADSDKNEAVLAMASGAGAHMPVAQERFVVDMPEILGVEMPEIQSDEEPADIQSHPTWNPMPGFDADGFRMRILRRMLTKLVLS